MLETVQGPRDKPIHPATVSTPLTPAKKVAAPSTRPPGSDLPVLPPDRHLELHTEHAGGNHLPGDQNPDDPQTRGVAGNRPMSIHDAVLAVLADALDDLEASRIATENRIRSLREIKGMEGTPQEADLLALLKGLEALERKATRNLEHAMREHPLGGFVEGRKGIGLKSIGRLLAAIGDPATRANPAKLWQYCGSGDPARSRLRKDAITYDETGKPRLPFSPRAKTLAWQVAESAVRQGHYRPVYLAAREACAEKVHAVECRNTARPPLKPNGCGTGAHREWGEIGSPWRDGHKHAHALRIVRKTILLDLWKYARDLPAEPLT